MVAFCVVACSDTPQIKEPPLSVKLADCAQLLKGPRCVLPQDRTLTLWSKTAAKLNITVDEKPLTTTWTSTRGGQRASIELPKESRTLKVSAPGHAPWTLPLSKQAVVSERLDKAIAASRASAKKKAWPEAIAARREAIDESAQKGITSVLARQYLALAYLQLFGRWDGASAQAAIERAAKLSAVDESAAGYVAYYRGLLARELGDRRASRRWLLQAMTEADRLGLEDLAWGVAQPFTRMLTSLGRFEEALALQRKTLNWPPAQSSACRRANALNNYGWTALLARMEGHRVEAPTGPLNEALSLFDGACDDRSLKTNLYVNLVGAHLVAKDLNAAIAAMKKARALSPLGPYTEAWALNFEGEIARAQGRFKQSKRFFSALDAHAQAIAKPEHRGQAQLGLARCEKALGKLESAVHHYRAAERIYDEQSLAIAMGKGRTRFLSMHRTAGQELTALLWASDRTDEAVATARRTRRRLFAQLRRARAVEAMPKSSAWAKAALAYRRDHASLDRLIQGHWSLPSEEKARSKQAHKKGVEALTTKLEVALAKVAARLPTPTLPKVPKNVLTIGFFHLGEQRWLAYAQSDQKLLKAVEIAFDPNDPTSAATHGSALLEPFKPLMNRFAQLRLLVDPKLERIDLHAARLAPTSNERSAHLPVFARIRVTYGLDLAVAPSGANADPSPKAVLVVADPRGDLPGARDEAKYIAQRMTGASMLVGRRATRGAVLQQLEGVHRLHFAGHGRFLGMDGWDSTLILAAQDTLSIADIFTMARPPKTVVLTGCETASSGERERLGLAHAFVLSGSLVVVAATREVDDDVALRFAKALYADPKAPLVEAFHHAQRHLLKTSKTSDWAPFRIIVP